MQLPQLNGLSAFEADFYIIRLLFFERVNMV